MTTTMTGTVTDVTRQGERHAVCLRSSSSGRGARLPSARVSACSDEGSSARDVPTGGPPAEPRPGPPPRPRIVDEPGILGLSRLTRGRFGSRLFNWFFVLVFVVILIQMVSALLEHPW
jgi:hypothetical protein